MDRIGAPGFPGVRGEIIPADMEAAENIIGSETYDVILCCGVLMF